MIKNVPTKTGNTKIDDLRGAIEHRATWFYYLIEAAKKRGLDTSFAREAIFNCGAFHGKNKYSQTDDIKKFANEFANENVVGIFEMDVKPTDEKLDIDFHYCPLVAAWKKLGASDEYCDELCDIAMDGDRGIISEFGAFDFDLGKTIAKGDSVCEIRITKKK